MTLILSLVSQTYALQVSDRLVTDERGKFDEQSNKSLICWARDGIFACSYSGIAYLDEADKLNTDHWIAQILCGETLPSGSYAPMCMLRKPRGLPDVGLLLRNLSNSLEETFNGLSDHARASPFQLAATGWQWTNRI
jgi:hypothetical protein